MLEGNGLRIRTIRESDLKAIYDLEMNYSDTRDFMPVSLSSEVDFRSEFAKDGFWRDTCGKLIIENTNSIVVGEIGCFKGTHYLDGREVYYRIFDGHRRKGYAKEALRIFINFFFESSSLNRLQGVTVDGNDVSARMLQDNGFQLEGKFREARWFKGRLVDLNVFSLLRKEWAHNK